jgi:hypothetical protein
VHAAPPAHWHGGWKLIDLRNGLRVEYEISTGRT